MNYIVLELQKALDGTLSSITYTFNNRNDAESKYHYVLSFAAVTTLPLHSVILLDELGELINSEYYQNIPEPSPEPEPEPEEA